MSGQFGSNIPGLCIISPGVGTSGNRQGCWGGGSAGRDQIWNVGRRRWGQLFKNGGKTQRGKGEDIKDKREEGVMKEKSKGIKENKKAPQKSLKEKRKTKKEKKNR
jgi:hypothetical protein